MRGRAVRAAWKRYRWSREQRSLEASLFLMGGYGAWQRVKRINDATGVWRYQALRNRLTLWGGGAACVAVFAVLVLSGFGSSAPKPDTAACKAAMVQQWKTVLGTAVPAAPVTEPPACKGLDNATLQALWVQAGNEVSGS